MIKAYAWMIENKLTTIEEIHKSLRKAVEKELAERKAAKELVMKELADNETNI